LTLILAVDVFGWTAGTFIAVFSTSVLLFLPRTFFAGAEAFDLAAMGTKSGRTTLTPFAVSKLSKNLGLSCAAAEITAQNVIKQSKQVLFMAGFGWGRYLKTHGYRAGAMPSPARPVSYLSENQQPCGFSTKNNKNKKVFS
jgi:hypothetical protein